MPFLLLFFSLLALIPTALFAATDGSLGTTSTGTSDIDVYIPPRVVISKVDNMALSWNGSGSKTESDDICIYNSEPSGTYKVTIIGSGSGGAFTIDNDQGNEMTYEVTWSDTTGTSDSITALAGVTIPRQTGACNTSTTCDDCGSTNANYQIKFTTDTLEAARAGIYAGIISLTVEPD